MDDNDMQGWAHQQELEHQRWLEEFDCPDNKEIENYGDKHGI